MLVEFIESPLGFLKATFEFKQPPTSNAAQRRCLRIALDITWLDQEPPQPAEIAEIRKIFDNSSYALAEPIDCADCYWHNVMALLYRCHEQSRQFSKKIITNVHIEEALIGAPLKAEVTSVLTDRAERLKYAVSD
jgi:hypothetical protein